jgi:hypothetical protein
MDRTSRGRAGRATARAGVALLAAAALVTVLATVAAVAGAARPASRDLGRPTPAALAVGVPTALSLSADHPLVPVGRAVTLTGRLTDPSTGAGIAGAEVRLETLDAATGAWYPLRDAATDDGGGVTLGLVPSANHTYRLRHAEPGTVEGSTSRPVTVRVSELTARRSPGAVRSGRAVRLSGVLVAGPGSLLRVERRSAGRWVPVGTTRTAADQSWSFTVRPDAPGFWRWRVVREGTAHRSRLVAALPRVDAYRMHTYSVATRGGVRADLAAFRAQVAATYADPRGWARAHHRFREVRRGGDFTVVLARPAYLPRFAGECSTRYSCRSGRWVVINSVRWAMGSPHFSGTLPTYRRYLVDHETGHWLGLGHAPCPRRGAPAPVMLQQSKGLQGCRPNPWPLAREVRAVS